MKGFWPRTSLLCKRGSDLQGSGVRTVRGPRVVDGCTWKLTHFPEGHKEGRTWLCFLGTLGVCQRRAFLLGIPMINYLLWATKQCSAGVTHAGTSWTWPREPAMKPLSLGGGAA